MNASCLILNGDTPLSYVDPGVGRQMGILAYLTVGTLAVFIWELLNVLWYDICVLRSTFEEVLNPTLYVISRATVLGYLIVGSAFQTTPMGYCRQTHTLLTSLYLIAMSSTSFLVLCRVRFLSRNDKFITSTFGLLLLFVLGGLATRIIGIRAESIGPTKYCTFSEPITLYASAFLIAPLLYTSTAFIFSAARFASRRKIDFAAPNGFLYFIFADCASVVRAGLLKDGQGYYLSSIVLQLTSLIFFLSSSTAPGKLVLVDCSLVIMNIMVCRVYISDQKYRETRSGEKVKKEQVMLGLGLHYHNGLQTSRDFQGIQVTKTVENFIT